MAHALQSTLDEMAGEGRIKEGVYIELSNLVRAAKKELRDEEDPQDSDEDSDASSYGSGYPYGILDTILPWDEYEWLDPDLIRQSEGKEPLGWREDQPINVGDRVMANTAHPYCPVLPRELVYRADHKIVTVKKLYYRGFRDRDRSLERQEPGFFFTCEFSDDKLIDVLDCSTYL